MRLTLAIACATLAAFTPDSATGAAPEPTFKLRGDYKHQVLRYFRETYKDPYSLKSARISKPVFVKTLLAGSFWFICVEVNAKNSYGAYTGIRTVGLYMNEAGRFNDNASAVELSSCGPMSSFPELEAIR